MVKLLILSSNPKDTAPLRLAEEVRNIKDVIKQSKYRDQFEISERSAVRIDDLRSALLTERPQIVHFSGHGSGQQGLVLENVAGQMQLVSTAALSDLFGLFKTEIDCVVLNACYTEAQLDAIHQHIDTVIGMNQAIGDRAAIEFAIGFYSALGAAESYARAYDFGRNAIDLQGIPERLTPVLKTRNSKVPSLQLATATQNSPSRVPSNPSDSITMNAGDNAKQFGHFVNDGTVNFN